MSLYRGGGWRWLVEKKLQNSSELYFMGHFLTVYVNLQNISKSIPDINIYLLECSQPVM